MKKYKYLEEEEKKEAELEEKDYFLIKSIDNLANEIQRLRTSNGR